MPLSYVIDVPRATIRTRCIGETSLAEVLGHFQQLAQDPLCPERLSVLLDLSETTSLPDTQQLHIVADAIRGIRYRVQFAACAIIASTDAMFGMLRMFAVFAEPYFESISVFRTAAEAEPWFTAQCEKVANDRRQQA